MKMKRFFAPDIRQAMRNIRQELGAEAVILSNKQVEGGVEIVAAMDYDDAAFQSASVSTFSNQSERSVTPAIPAAPQTVSKIDMAYAEIATSREDYNVPPGRIDERAKFESSQEPTLNEMRKELKTLRGLLEKQLSGFAWGDMFRRNPAHMELLQRLGKLGLSATLCKWILAEVSGHDLEDLWRQAIELLTTSTQVTNDDILNDGGLVALMGPTGVGKTTTIAKLAARYALRHGPRHVALVSTDNYRIGAHEQLRSYGRILGIPVRIASDMAEFGAILEDFYDKRLVLIDTAGMSQRDSRLAEQFSVMGKEKANIKNYLVLSSATRLSTINETLKAYSDIQMSGCILTKLDETTCLGSALSALIQKQLPISYISDGQRVPEDLHPARSAALISRSLSIMQQSSELLDDESMSISFAGVAANANV